MKKLLIALWMLGFLAACEKQQFHSIKTTSEIPQEETIIPIKMAGNKKRKLSCKIYDNKDRFVARGSECAGQGTQCEYTTGCIATSLSDGGNVVFEDMNLDEFVAMWNTDDGRTYLESKGCYSKIDE